LRELTKSEYFSLRKHCDRKPFERSDIEPIDLASLFSLGYLCRAQADLRFENDAKYADKIVITANGLSAYEHYHDEIYNRRMTSMRSWIALGISALSLSVSVISLIAEISK